MLRGQQVGLRARRQADVAVLHAELQDDVVTRSRAGADPWEPVSVDGNSPFAVGEPGEKIVRFSVVTLADDALAGVASMWGIDTHNRFAHIGVSLLPAYRGRGLGADVVEVLCHYGFVARGFHRLQVDTLGDNAAMIAAARRSGFVMEGTMREAAWVMGEFIDEVVLGLLASDWTPQVPDVQ
jgi:RimJ/RimL family protein N-acetyltransferase